MLAAGTDERARAHGAADCAAAGSARVLVGVGG